MSIEQSVKDRFIELRAQGLTYDLIAQELNVSKRTLLFWNRELKDRIDLFRAVHLESLLDRYCALRERRIELFGKKLQDLTQNLDNRDLYAVPTAKLLNLVLRYAGALKKEETDVRHMLDTPQEETPDPALEPNDENHSEPRTTNFGN
jgi:hypothetical protein